MDIFLWKDFLAERGYFSTLNQLCSRHFSSEILCSGSVFSSCLIRSPASFDIYLSKNLWGYLPLMVLLRMAGMV